ncbi:hypothetical protein GCM10010446_58980 [Streptomyces enissocaesilis]|uniref:Uncharacterized protein n=1 Tax=Streptomyces enissocaesilis TaxID=332589 RepID=A0ABP6K348_9ACTN
MTLPPLPDHRRPGRRFGDRDRAVGGGTADRVDQEAGEDPGRPACVHFQREGLRRVTDEAHTLFAGERAGARKGLAGQVVGRGAHRRQGERARLDAGGFEEAADHGGEPGGPGTHPVRRCPIPSRTGPGRPPTLGP